MSLKEKFNDWSCDHIYKAVSRERLNISVPSAYYGIDVPLYAVKFECIHCKKTIYKKIGLAEPMLEGVLA